MTLEFVLRCAVRGRPDALEMVVITLDRMADGGIYDLVGGGFARYATDAMWHVPHFEKMLYDNAQLVRLYARTWQVTGNERYRRVVAETVAYLLREMRHPDGGFFSSQDADSEGVEGKFFTWPWEELVDLVGEQVARSFGATPEGNWEATNVLWRPFGSGGDGAGSSELEEAARLLFERREKRIRPGIDDKVLTAWNGLLVGALAEAGRAMDEPGWVEAAARAAEFVLESLRTDDGRLLRSWRDGRGGRPGFADDHAAMAGACLTLYETTFEVRWFEEARRLADELIRLFLDDEGRGFFQSGSDAERLVIRPKDPYDNAVPSGNSLAAEVLLRIGLLTGEPEYDRAAESALQSVGVGLAEAPTGFGQALSALDLYLGPSREVAIVGDPGLEATRALVDEVTVRRYLPNVVLAVAGPDDGAAREVVPLLRDRTAIDGRPAAYVCERFACRLPVTDPEELAKQLTG
jgi:uncharacterized protein YyaL (SSP411 family)